MANSVQFVTNDSGQKTAVVLPIAEYERFKEDSEDYAVIADRRKEPTIPHEQFCKRIKTRWLLTVLSGADPQIRIFG